MRVPNKAPLGHRLAVLALALACAGSPALAKEEGKDKAALGALGGGSKEPIKIDADRLDVFDKENRAVFAGNVVAVQGDATIRCSALTVHYNRGKKDGKDAAKDASKDADAGGKGSSDKSPSDKSPSDMAENGIRRVDCAGPVTVKQKDQTATGDNAVFDQVARRIVLTGNVVLSQCQNVTRGSRLVYDMESGRANMDPGANGRVSAMFVPGDKDAKGGGAKGTGGCALPATKAKPAEAAGPAPGPAPSPKTRAQAN